MIDRHIVRGVRVWDRKSGRDVEIDVDVEIHVDEIARLLGAKAFNNTAQNHLRKARALAGLVKVSMRGTLVREVAA